MRSVSASRQRRFTDRQIQSLKPRNKRYEVYEASGLIIRVTPKGTKSFIYFYRFRGRTRRITLGRYPKTSLAEAREKFENAKSLRERGIDPAKHGPCETVTELAEEFYKRHVEKNRKRPDAARQILDADVIPKLRPQKLADLTTRDVIRALDEIVDRGSPAHANKTLALLKQMFRYGVGRGVLQANPAADIKRSMVGGRELSRDRVLGLTELRDVWLTVNASKKVSLTIRLAIKLLILTGVRTGELRTARWEHINDDLWTIPGELTKSGREHLVPLTSMSTSLLHELRTAGDGSPWVLASPTKSGPLSEKAIARAVARLQDKVGIPHWTAHDLRRSFGTHLGDLGVTPYIVEKCLGHRFPKVMDAYNKNEYLQERREALQLWADQINRLIHLEDNVVMLRTT